MKKNQNVLFRKDFSKQNSESAADGHLKNPSRAYRDCNALIAKREGLANLLLPEDVDEALDLYSGGKNKNKRKRQLSSDVKKYVLLAVSIWTDKLSISKTNA